MPELAGSLRRVLACLAGGVALGLSAQVPDGPPPQQDGPPFDGPPPFGPGGFPPGDVLMGGPGRGGFGGPMQQEIKVVKQFDQDGDKRLNAGERKVARAWLSEQRGNRGRGGFGGPRGGFGGFGERQTPVQPGRQLTLADVKPYPDVPLYEPTVLRTFFLEFENPDWEKELSDFNDTDVEVPAKLTVDGKTYPDVGVRFRGSTSLMMVGEGRKKPLNLSLDFVHKDQQLGGYRTLNLLNAHQDPTLLQTVLFYHIAREYSPAPKANFVRVVINGESWGVYINAQQFNKDFTRDFFGSTKGARWKVPGSPGGRGGLSYLGDEISPYRRIYEIKSKDDAKSWGALLRFCKVLNQTPADQLEPALAPILDIDGTLKFLAVENVLVNQDGFWTRASDYDIYLDEHGRFHFITQDANESFSSGGGPGGPGGPPGFGGPGGPGGFGPGMMLAPQILGQADKNKNGKLTPEEFGALAERWFDKLDPDKTGKLSLDQFTAKLDEVLPPPQGFGPAPGGQADGAPGPGRGRGGFGPAMVIGPGLFQATDANKDGSLTRAELKQTFGKWFQSWDSANEGSLGEEQLHTGLNEALPQPNFGDRGRSFGGGGGRGRGGAGFGGRPGMGGTQLDPLVGANDSSKPLLSKLLAVPALRARYLGYVREIADKWLDWNRLGPVAKQYQALIADDVKADTRKLQTTEAFLQGLEGGGRAGDNRGGPGGFGSAPSGSLKSFADQRRAFLLSYFESSPDRR